MTEVTISHNKINALGAFFTGRRILSVIPGLRANIWRDFFINLVLSIAICAGALYVGFKFMLNPMESFLTGFLPGWLDWTAVSLKYGLGVLLIFLSLFLSIIIPLNVMFLWYENLVQKVVTYLGTSKAGEPIKTPLPVVIKTILKEISIIVGLLVIGFIPIVGPVIVFILSSHVMGRASFDPYIGVMKNLGYDIAIPQRKFGSTTISIGALEAGLPIYLPVLGIFLIPWVVIHVTIGVAYMMESRRLNKS